MTTHIYRAPTVMLAFWITMMDCSGRKPPGREDKFPPPQSGRKDRYLPLQTPPFPQSRSTDKDPARSLGMFSPPATVATGNRDRMSSFVPRAQEEPVQIPSSATQPINSHPVWRPIRGHQGKLLIFLFEFSSNLYLDDLLIRNRPTAWLLFTTNPSSSCW